MTVLVTGGAGFIGSAFVRRLLAGGHRVVVLDALTYAGNLDNLAPCPGPAHVLLPALHRMAGTVEFTARGETLAIAAPEREAERWSRKLRDRHAVEVAEGALRAEVAARIGDVSPPMVVVVGHVTDRALADALVPLCDAAVHFAAETHVDRSLADADAFVRTDVQGTCVLLEAARAAGLRRLVHVSTDEVHGVADAGGFSEHDPLRPRNPYAAAKAAAEHLVRAYAETWGVAACLVRPSNVFGPRQHPEKLVPLAIIRALAGRAVPLYGDGRQVRDWLFVDDAARAVELVLERGAPGEAYNVAGRNERENVEVVRRILGRLGRGEDLIRHVTDRPGHDRRYALDDRKIRNSLGYVPSGTFEDRLDATVDWYVANEPWWRQAIERDPECREFMDRWYAERG